MPVTAQVMVIRLQKIVIELSRDGRRETGMKSASLVVERSLGLLSRRYERKPEL